MDRHDNVFLSDTAETYDFSSTPKPGGELQIPFRTNRQSHSDKLVAQFREAQNHFNSYTPEQVAAISYNTGTYVEFVGAENCDLVTKSLEDNRQGIKLLNVRDVFSEYDENHIPKITTKATVFIPTGKEDVFIKKIKDFATKQTKSGKPKNNDLVSSIESISDAIKISSFWVGRPTEMPNETKRWYELWVDVDEENFDIILQNTFNIFNDLNLEHRQETEYIRFPERLVLPVFANRLELLSLIKQGVTIAEIRKPAEPNAFFLDSSVTEQTEWADDLFARTKFNDSGVTVCILDTGVNNNHKLISPYMPISGTTVNSSWGTQDKNGHGTNMAGVILYNDLKRYLITNAPFELNHTIESVKIIEPSSPMPTQVTLYGSITEQAALLPEISNPTVKRIYCMAITDPTSGFNDGQPSSWSAAVDKISAEGKKRLFIISGGNVEEGELKTSGYPNACLNKSIEDPAQAWNALTVGAYSIDSTIQPGRETKGYYPVAQYGELSPYSSTSNEWKTQWPIKPEVVCDGGNVASDGTNFIQGMDELSKLTLSKDINRRLFDTIWATSAATAQCSYISAELMAAYPSMRPETLRALIVHSARWTTQMINQFGVPDTKTQGRKKLLRTCGYGVPNLEIAKDTLNNRVNMIVEGELQPYEKKQGSSPKMKEMHLHTLPWPESVLQTLENKMVKVRVTLSYFIESGPGQKGWKNKYRYSSCGLRFDMKRPNETLKQFQQRINNLMRDDDYQNTSTTENNWYLGSKNRDVGSIHSDVWEDTAINLAQSGIIAVYPVVGWWRERTTLKKYNSKIPYSLVVTIETPEENVDLYTPIMTKIASRVTVPITTSNNT